MILYYEDEQYSMSEYIDLIKENGWKIEVYDSAVNFLSKFRESFEIINLLIIDIMVFGPGNNFEGRDTSFGLESGIVLLDEIEEIENNKSPQSRKLKIILTNKIESQVEKLKNDKRIDLLLLKPHVGPFDLIEDIKKLIN